MRRRRHARGPRARPPLRAQFVVFDPSNYEQAMRGFIQLQQQYAQLVTTYQLLKAQSRAGAR